MNKKTGNANMETVAVKGSAYRAADYVSMLDTAHRSLPYSLRVLAENVYRQDPSGAATRLVGERAGAAVPMRPARLILQDMLGLPLLVDLMAIRAVIAETGGDPARIDMSLPVDLIIDHAMTIEHWAEEGALARNLAREFEVNAERFSFIKACGARFANLRVVPPGAGIMHQINLEHLAQVACPAESGSSLLICDTCLGTDSHTPMVNGLGVLGWGIGGMEAEAIMLGEATTVNVPRVVGLELRGSLTDAATATDIALTVAEKLRAVGVVDCFVELFGDGYRRLTVADRGTIANMAPEYGATSVFCPCDANTIRYLRQTGRTPEHARRVEAYNRTQGLWMDPVSDAVEYDAVVTLNLSAVGRSVAGPSRPEQRIDLGDAARALSKDGDVEAARRFPVPGTTHDIGDGDVIIAAITSCTNTANPRNMILAGLIARNAVERGLSVKPHVKTSLAPGSRVVAQYLKNSGLQASLSALGFDVAAFSCSTCNGMSGPLRPEHEATIKAHDINGVAVLSGNRNFPGRIHPLASRNVLAAPPLVVAYAIAGTILRDITREPLAVDRDGKPVMLVDLWPAASEVDAVIAAHLQPDDFRTSYATIASVNDHWNALEVSADDYEWAPSTYVTFPPYVRALSGDGTVIPMRGLRPLAILGDSVTTDHISPSGTITPESDAGRFLIDHGVEPRDFNSFGTRRGCSEIVIRSTFANVRLRNELTPEREGPWTRLQPDGPIVSMFEAIEAYRAGGQQLLVIGGRDYGCGSSRDTAAKAPWLAGIRAVVVESFERIHRSNLVNMGIAPLCFPPGVTRKTLRLDGSETYDIDITDDLEAATVTINRANGETETLALDLRLYNDAERETFRQGGLLPRAFRDFMTQAA